MPPLLRCNFRHAADRTSFSRQILLKQRQILHRCVNLVSCPNGRARTASYHTAGTTPKVVFSGIQPTGVPHLGNYLGALKPWVDLQETSEADTTLIYSVVDLHSLTSRTQTAEQRRVARSEMLATFLAIGLDPDRSVLFYQADVPYHTELHWILSCDASMGFLSRMNQWKSKLGDDGIAALLQPTANPRSEERLKLGLFSYPVLQAADILLYRTTDVPVGEDQVQHVEFARSIATAFNANYGHGGQIGADGRKQKGRSLLVAPEFRISPAKRVMSLTEPTKKMSKSDAQVKSRILLSDSSDAISKKIKSALTDSESNITFDPTNRPGLSNLIEIISHLDGSAGSCSDIAAEFDGLQTEGSKMRLLKDRAAQVIDCHLAPIRERYAEVLSRNASAPGSLQDIADAGAQKASKMAKVTMDRVREATGLA